MAKEVLMMHLDSGRTMMATVKAAKLMEKQGWKPIDEKDVEYEEPKPQPKQFDQRITRDDVNLEPKSKPVEEVAKEDDEDDEAEEDDSFDDDDEDAEEEYEVLKKVQAKTKEGKKNK